MEVDTDKFTPENPNAASAVEDLFNQYNKDITGCLRYSGGTPEDVEDAVSIVWLKILERYDRIKITSARGFLLTVAFNNFREAIRRNRRPAYLSNYDENIFLPPTLRYDLEEDIEDKITVDELFNCGRLRLQEKDVLKLRYLEGLSIQETAQLLGIAEGTVKSRASRGAEKARQFLKSP